MWRMICCLAEPPSFINTLPTVTKIAESQTAVLVCQVFGAPKPVITWKMEDTDVIMGGRFRKDNNGNLHITVSENHYLLWFFCISWCSLFFSVHLVIYFDRESILTLIYGLWFLTVWSYLRKFSILDRLIELITVTVFIILSSLTSWWLDYVYLQ